MSEASEASVLPLNYSRSLVSNSVPLIARLHSGLGNSVILRILTKRQIAFFFSLQFLVTSWQV